MLRKKVNGNIIGARWQGIRLCEEIIAVNRCIGGLEIKMAFLSILFCVNRRIGGWENLYFGQLGCIVLMKNNIGCVIIEVYSL